MIGTEKRREVMSRPRQFSDLQKLLMFNGGSAHTLMRSKGWSGFKMTPPKRRGGKSRGGD